MRPTLWLKRHGKLRVALAVAVATAGLGVAGLTLMLGHCSAFAGRCPADPVPLWEDDVFGGVGIAVAASVLAVAAAVRPDRRGLAIGAVAAVAVGLIAGWLAAGVAAG